MSIKRLFYLILKYLKIDLYFKKIYYWKLINTLETGNFISSNNPSSINKFPQSIERRFESHQFSKPIFLNDGNKKQYEFYYKNIFDYPTVPYYYKIDNAYLIGPEAVGLTSEGTVILDTVLNRKDLVLRSSPGKILEHKKLPVDVIYDNVISLVNIYNNGFYSNYFHWIADCLFLLKAAEIFNSYEKIDLKILISKNPNKWQLETLSLMGYKNNDLIYWDVNKAFVKSLIVPSVLRRETATYAIFPTEILKWFQNKLSSSIKFSGEDFKNIYISRKRCKSRNIKNSNQFAKLLNNYDFKEVILEDLTVSEQIERFLNSKNILSVHGAGLTNLIFCKNKNIIELVGNSNTNYHYTEYYKIGTQLNNNYYVLFCPHFYSDENMQLQNYDIEVDVEKLNHHLELILKKN